MAASDTLANQLINSLTTEADFTIPKIDMSGPEWKIPGDINSPPYQPVHALTEADLTTRLVGGTGLFDGLMAAFNAQIGAQFEKGRITGDDYVKAYIAMSDSAVQNAVQYLMNKDQAYWAAVMAQTQAITARVTLEMAKVQLQTARLEAMNQRANFALTKLKLATESNQYDQGVYQLTQIMPEQHNKLIAENRGVDINNQIADYTRVNILPNQNQKLVSEIDGLAITNDTAQYNRQYIQPAQVQNLLQQRLLLDEQTAAQRAQTTDNRPDGLAVTGLLGKQKDLYAQQILSYQRDAEVKMAKIFSDAWITQKTIDEGLLAPTNFQNGSIDTILANLKAKNGF